jgi:DNA-binding MarR family transcriptional regulator
MGKDQTQAMGDLIAEVRMLFRELRGAIQTIHGEEEPTAGRRGILADLLEGGPQTVPNLARRRNVSRQHVQVLVNSLLSDGLVDLECNPAHKRSRLVAITSLGRETIRSMLGREAALLRTFPIQATPTEVAQAVEVLRRATEAFRSEEWKEIVANDG